MTATPSDDVYAALIVLLRALNLPLEQLDILLADLAYKHYAIQALRDEDGRSEALDRETYDATDWDKPQVLDP
jgi:hypothetical protein